MPFNWFYLIERFLHRPELRDELLGRLFVAVVDELEVHVDEDGVENKGQLVAGEVERALDKPLEVLK